MQEAQRLLEGAGRKATVNLRKGLRVVEEEEGKEKEQAAIEGLAEQVELVCGSRTHMNSLTVEYLPHWRFPGSIVFMGISIRFCSVILWLV